MGLFTRRTLEGERSVAEIEADLEYYREWHALYLGVPVPEIVREVAPGRPRAGKIEDGFDEHPIAEHRGMARTGFYGSEDGSHLRPCLICE